MGDERSSYYKVYAVYRWKCAHLSLKGFLYSTIKFFEILKKFRLWFLQLCIHAVHTGVNYQKSMTFSLAPIKLIKVTKKLNVYSIFVQLIGWQRNSPLKWKDLCAASSHVKFRLSCLTFSQIFFFFCV